jgi:hypothetical protein
MATNPKAPMKSGPVLERSHNYHAEAHIFSGHLEHPIKQPIETFGRVVLENTRRESLITQSVGETNIEGLISFKRGHARVVGSQVKNKTDIFGNDHAGWVTLSTAVLEGFNVIDIITADGVVAQVSTEHPMTEGHVPRVTFLGTRFENLRVGGYPVEVELDLGICGSKPAGDRPYLEDAGFLDRVQRQVDSVAHAKGLPDSMEKQCTSKIAYIDDLRKRAKGGAKGERNGYSKLQCSLVKNIGPIPIPGIKTFGNLIFIPNFGTVALAEVEVGIGSEDGGSFSHTPNDLSSRPSDSNYFTLNMLDLKLGCPVSGSGMAAKVTSNGNTHP